MTREISMERRYIPNPSFASIVKGILQNVHSVLENHRFMVHFGTTTVAAWFAFQIGKPGQTFSTSQNYRYFAETWPYTENGWTVLLACVAVFSYSALMLRDRRVLPLDFQKLGPIKLRRASFVEGYQLLAAFVLFATHFEISYCFWMATDLKTHSHLNTGFGTYGVVSGFSLLVLYWTARNRGIYDG